jgi:hypothetical protein
VGQDAASERHHCRNTNVVHHLHGHEDPLTLRQMTLDNFGTLTFFSNGQNCYWFGRVKNISPDNEVELTINVDGKDQSLTTQHNLIADFVVNYDRLTTILYNYLRKSFASTGDNKTIDDLRKMYILSSVELKKDNKDWWIVFEPTSNVETIYNFLPRFTLRDNTVTWSNLR